jgi:hypothetical protein
MAGEKSVAILDVCLRIEELRSDQVRYGSLTPSSLLCP